MGGLGMVLIYGLGAALLAGCARYMPWLRRRVGWHDFRDEVRVTSESEAVAKIVADFGTSRSAKALGKWQVYRASIGVRIMTLGLTLAVGFTLAVPDDGGGMTVAHTPPEILAAIALMCLWGNFYVWRFQASTDGTILRIR